MYLIGMAIIFLFILVLALPQIAATCSWYKPFSSSTSPTLALFQAAGLGAVLGGLSVLYWKSLKEPMEEDTEDTVPGKPKTSMDKEDK